MKAAVLGAGLTGSVISWDLARSKDVDQIVAADVSKEKLARVRRLTGSRRLTTEVIDASDSKKLSRFLREFDVVACALPQAAAVAADRVAIGVGTKIVDIAFEDGQMELAGLAKKNGSILIPGCGLAPGLGSILLAHGARMFDEPEEGHILVGGIPQYPKRPFDYKLVFPVASLMKEYLEEARVVRNGKVVKVKPFEMVEKVMFPSPVGKCEAFCTDGLATLIHTMNGMKILDEKTVRWPGHVEKIKLLIEAGFFSREKVSADGTSVSPLAVTAAVLERELQAGDPQDITVLRVEVKGRKNGIGGGVTYEMVDFYNKKTKTTSMARTTGFTCAVVAVMVGNGEIKDTGVVPPEIALNEDLVKKLLGELHSKGVRINEVLNWPSSV